MLLISFSLGFMNVDAQILINSDKIPNDKEQFSFYFSEQKDIPLGLAGENKLWDFTTIEGKSIESTVYTTADNSLQSEYDIESFDGIKTKRYKKRTFGLFEINRSGKDPFFGFSNNLIILKQERIDRLFFLRYQNYHNSNFEYNIQFSKDQLPAHILKHLPNNIDSILINVFCKNEIVVDAWGKLLLRNQTFERTPRVKNKTTYSARIVYKNDEEWKEFDFSDKPDLIEIYKNQVDIKYQFYHIDYYEPIMTIYTAKDGSINGIRYMSIPKKQLLNTPLKSKVYIHPNPNFGDFKVIFSNVTKGKYSFYVSNILGKKIWSKTYDIDQNGTFEENLSYLSRGSYIYYFKDEDGNRISTRKMTLLKP